MKKEYISPEVEVIEIGLKDGILNKTSITIGGDMEDDDVASRDNYDDNTPSRPGSGNVWDQGW